MNAGQIVRYAQPEPGEEHLTFVLVELNGDRAMIQSRDFPDWRYPPVENVLVADIVPA